MIQILKASDLQAFVPHYASLKKRKKKKERYSTLVSSKCCSSASITPAAIILYSILYTLTRGHINQTVWIFTCFTFSHIVCLITAACSQRRYLNQCPIIIPQSYYNLSRHSSVTDTNVSQGKKVYCTNPAVFDSFHIPMDGMKHTLFISFHQPVMLRNLLSFVLMLRFAGKD